ncbi:hypothetical protein BX616_004958, partial [Lobosporangium transversale]
PSLPVTAMAEMVGGNLRDAVQDDHVLGLFRLSACRTIAFRFVVDPQPEARLPMPVIV